MKRFVIVRLQFEGVHHWNDCPHEDVEFLRYAHRHVFHVEATKEVRHNDRDIEIVRFKRSIKDYIEEFFYEDIEELYLGDQSCEMMAEEILKKFDCQKVRILEDNENGAEIQKD